MMFNHRRQSRDRNVIKKLVELTDTKLWVNEYSALLFDEYEVCVNTDFLKLAKSGEYCFVENIDIDLYLDQVEEIIVFRWNCRYPADVWFDLTGWRLIEQSEFIGYSHPKITQEVYRR